MRRTTRLFLLLEAASFAVAGSIHFGLLSDGYEHRQAAIAESVIAFVLFVGFGLTWAWWAQTRLIGLAAQTFALLLTLVGLFTIAVGVGPRTVPDVIFHLSIVVVLVSGLVITARAHGAVQWPVAQPWAVGALCAVTYLVLALVFAQAVLGGEWLAGHSALLDVHSVNGDAILIMALLQVVLAGLAGRRRLAVLGTTGLFLLLVVVQETLGFAGSKTANQARALHISNGVLLFGLALANVHLTRQLRSSVSSRPDGSVAVPREVVAAENRRS